MVILFCISLSNRIICVKYFWMDARLLNDIESIISVENFIAMSLKLYDRSIFLVLLFIAR